MRPAKKESSKASIQIPIDRLNKIEEDIEFLVDENRKLREENTEFMRIQEDFIRENNRIRDNWNKYRNVLARLEDVLLVIHLNPTMRDEYFSEIQILTNHNAMRIIGEAKLEDDDDEVKIDN